jgi:hypothetical protein
VPGGIAVVVKEYVPFPSGSWSHERRQLGSQSPGQPSSDWKLPGAIAIVVLRFDVTQWLLWS